MIQILWAWLAGYVVVKIKGPNIEHFLNEATKLGIGIWDIQRLSTDIIIAKLAMGNFSQLRPLLWNLSLQVSIVEKRGLPFSLGKLQRRKFLVVGLLVGVILIYYLSGFIWFIQITGTENISKEQISQVILGEGVRVGLPKSEFPTKGIETALLTSIPELAWAGVNLRGALLQVEVVERSMPDQETLKSGDLVAKRDGLITQVLPFRGTALVNAGDTVRTGDVLVSGDYYDLRGRKQQGRAEGIVRARVWYHGFGEAALTKITQHRTGNLEQGYQVRLGNYQLVWGKPSFSLYQVDSYTWKQQVRGHTIPLTFTKNQFYEVEYQISPVSHESAKALALERAWQMLEAQGVDRTKVTFTQVKEEQIIDEHGVRVSLLVELEENIGEFVPNS